MNSFFWFLFGMGLVIVSSCIGLALAWAILTIQRRTHRQFDPTRIDESTIISTKRH